MEMEHIDFKDWVPLAIAGILCLIFLLSVLTKVLRELARAPTRVRHYKGGLYEVMYVAQDATNTWEDKDPYRPMIVYRSVETGLYWVRPYTEFYADVTWPDGVVRPRFSEQVAREEFP